MRRFEVKARVSFALSFVGVTVCLAGPASAADVCIDDRAKQTLEACPNTGPQNFDVTKHGKAPQVNFSSAPPPLDLKKRDRELKPQNPDIAFANAQRDQRQQVLHARAKALLVTEIQGLENLFSGTPRTSPDRPTLARRLAEDYVELENAAFREKTQAEIDRDALKKTNMTEAGRKQAIANQANMIMSRARQNAIQYYKIIKNEYPNYPQLDEVLYYLAYEYEQGSDLANARKAYLELIDKAPKSKYVPHAYLAFGELFFNEAEGDPSKWDLARDAYKKVIEYPPERNKVYGYAWYKLAYVFWNKGEFDQALNAFKRTIDYGVAWASEPTAVRLAETARKDIIPVYALRGDPLAAYNFFHNISGDQPGQTSKTYRMMDDLGQNYLDTGHYPEAVSLYRDLMLRDRNSDKRCIYQTHVTEAILAMKSGNKDAIKAELDNQLKVSNAFRAQNHPADAVHECSNRTAELLAESAMAWHLETVGSHGQRGTGDQKTMTLAATLYEQITKTWSAQEFSTFTFPRIVKEDWPNIYKIKYAMADLLYFQERWDKCGPAFDAVVAENPNAPEAAEAAYASVLCYQKIYEETHARGEDKRGSGNLPGQKETKEARKSEEDARLRPRELTENQKGMIQAFNRYICYIHPAANDAQGQDQLIEVKYARARTYFEAQHWEEAAAGFREIAVENSDRDVGIYAAQLYLECINVLGSHSNPPRPTCYDDMNKDVPAFLKLYCEGDKQAKNAEQCTSLNKIQVDILRLKAQNLVASADRGGSDALKSYEEAGQSYLELFRNNCETPILAGQPPQAERCDEIIYNAAKAFQAARLVAKAVMARMKLIDPRFHLDDTPLAKKARYEIGANYQAIAVYDLAAEWYEKYADADRGAKKADLALSDAVQLRLGLGQEEPALKDAATFMKYYGSSKPAQTAAIAFAIGAHFAEKEDWGRAKTELQKYMGVIDRAAPDIEVEAHATLGRAFAALKNRPNARAEYARTRAIWRNPDDAVARINAAYPNEDDGAHARRVAKALNAVGEAYFYAAEEARLAKVEPLKFPEYKGTRQKDDVLRHINTKVVSWFQKKQAAINSVEPEYAKILELKPDKPPKWVIAAGATAGLMWGDFVDDFRKAPIPKAWEKDAEIRGVYYDALDAKSQPFKDRFAKPALKKCLDYSVQYEYFDEYSRKCEMWLAKNYKAEYHVMDELRGAPTLVNGGLDDKPPPLLVDGTAWHPPSTAPEKPEPSDSTDAQPPEKTTPARRRNRPKKR